MSTQHPDNAKPPFFADQAVIEGEAEIKEAYYALSNLGCREQMWDYEGKEVDAFVVKKLLTRYEDFFRNQMLGRDRQLTLRVPNPRVEQAEGKVLLETLESIPRSHDAARMLYGPEVPCPVVEVILPMTSSADELNRVYHYYREFVGGKEQQRCYDITVREWVGDYLPDAIRVIPLIENRDQLLSVDRIVEDYLSDKSYDSHRVFLARSDPALNYGQLSAVLLTKIALQRLGALEGKLGIELLPIIGVGSAPFRGNLNPRRVHEFLEEYPSVQTYTIQSAFKYDYPETEVRAGIETLNAAVRGPATEIDEKEARRIIDKVSYRFAQCVTELAPMINEIAALVPSRRARKLHIGLFGYSRELDGREHVHLPRAIGFCAALYSIGLPPELLGLAALGKGDLAFVRQAYQNHDRDLSDALRYLCVRNLKHLPPIVRKDIETALDELPLDVDTEHAELANGIMDDLRHGNPQTQIIEKIQRAAVCRRFLG